MDHFSYFFSPDSVLLTLVNQEKSAAIEETIRLLKQDRRVSDWQELFQTLATLSPAFLKVDEENAVAIYHTRTNSVQDLVMSAGRSIPGIAFQESAQPIRLIIVIGIPHALSQEYLRVLGSLARLIKEPPFFQKLLTTTSVDEFIDILSCQYE